ncbi:hypothetical protein BJV82DRAFT_317931 [Fennellomyces sp. T-0311]|nr:hypothetical protein BJV82DRAFT_317931 [Fennellomyces sp. T-0311]
MDFIDWISIPWESKHLSVELNQVTNCIKAEPHHASNYLSAGRLHLIRGDYEEGLKIFEQGISMVTFDDPQRSLLEQRKVHAETWIQRRVDIVSQCPYDIFSNIARYLTQKGAQECIGVCRIWRSRVFEDPGPWRKVSLRS